MNLNNIEKESFKPVAHHQPSTFLGRMLFIGRLLLDFQFNTIYLTLSKRLPLVKGKLLDVGCGNSPFKHLLTDEAKYYGIDVKEAIAFDYKNAEITVFDGNYIPFEDEYFDYIICTEVMEHVINPQILISEIKRVLKTNGQAVITIPWSARFHYKPYDYHRYTPSMLKVLFGNFSEIEIIPRGSDYSVIGNKLIVLIIALIKSFFEISIISILILPFKVLLTLLIIPIVYFWILITHLSLFLKFGNQDDPLGYTIILKK